LYCVHAIFSLLVDKYVMGDTCSLDGTDKHFWLENMKMLFAERREMRTGILRQIPRICAAVNWCNVGSGAWFFL
jgi:hypothetical protein